MTMVLADAFNECAPPIAFGLLLVAISGGLLWRHAQAWEGAQIEPESLKAIEFARRQHKRRRKASGLIGAVGLAIITSVFVREPILLVYWLAVLVLVMWILVLALADAMITMTFLQAHRRRHLLEQAQLQAELMREIKRRREGQVEGDDE